MEAEINNPLVEAAKRGNSDDVEKLSSAYENQETKARHFYSALYVAALQGHENIVRILLSKGADPNYCFEGCLPPLHAAAQKGRLSIANLLLNHGADVNPKVKSQPGSSRVSEVTEYFSTPLHTAARGGHVQMVKLLLDHGANINAKFNSTPVKVSHDIERIFAFGDYSDSNISSNSLLLGYTPLHFAIESGEKNIVKLLIQHGADINSESDKGETPIAFAFERNRDTIVNILKKAGAVCEAEIEDLAQRQLRAFREMFGTSFQRNNLTIDIESNEFQNQEDSSESRDMGPTPTKRNRVNESGCIIS